MRTRYDLTGLFFSPYLCVDDMLAHIFSVYRGPLMFRFESGACARDERLDEDAATTNIR